MGKLNIDIILGSTCQGRISPQVGKWVKEISQQHEDVNYEILDIADYNLPFLGTGTGKEQVGLLKGKSKLI
ncbi:NADPH-dependent FMN reductase [Cytobacillus depressus]|uniref:NADPH-dependent FMN reductase n=1 Tax=Cytobacillus depressus TaxID=1602942 RepID=UPI003CCD7EC7